jgi:hypothetical protein
MKLLILLLILLVLISGCTTEQNGNMKATSIENECINLCNSVKSKQDLSNGPCLSDTDINWNIEDWVCDVAHSPRQDVDNLPENQCLSYREGKTQHFVEVDPDCNLIRAI